PIYLVYAVGGFHNDFFMLVPAIGAVSLLLARRERAAGAALMLAVAVKFTAILLLPFLLVGAHTGRRRREVVVGVALATIPLIASLAWVMPWYVIWVLPLAALGSSIRLRRAAVVLTVFLVLVFLPSSGKFWSLIGFNPLSGRAGQASQTLQAKLSWYR